MISPLETIEYETAILDLIEKRDKYTQSDLQSQVAILVNIIMIAGQKLYIEEQLNNL